MNPDLSQLHDIHLPDPVSWWPLAPGWWILVAILLLLSGISFWWYRRRQANLWRKYALAECRKIKQLLATQPVQPQTQQQVAQQLSVLLRRVALSRFPRDNVASLSGQDWIDFLREASQYKTEPENEIAQLLLHAPYRQHSEQDIAPLLNFTERWINALPGKPQWSKGV